MVKDWKKSALGYCATAFVLIIGWLLLSLSVAIWFVIDGYCVLVESGVWDGGLYALYDCGPPFESVFFFVIFLTTDIWATTMGFWTIAFGWKVN